MIERVWLIADADTGDASYIQHGKEDEDQDNWRLIGPFAFTSMHSATQAANNPTFFPDGVEARLKVLEVESSGFIQAIFNGFPPSHTDAFMLDDGVFPLTRSGAGWVDEALDFPLWEPLFDENGLTGGVQWLNRVLEQVAHRMKMSMETVLAIGNMNAAEEDAAVASQTEALVHHNVRIAVIPEDGTLALNEEQGSHTLSPAARFVVATSGLRGFGLPELEFRNVPVPWVEAAGAELRHWACVALGEGVCEGDTLERQGPVPYTYEVRESENPMWRSKNLECLHLAVAEVRFAAGHKRHTKEGPLSLH